MNLSTFSANKLTILVFNLLFSRKTWLALFILGFAGSVYLNTFLFHKAYVFRCLINGEPTGFLMTQAKCDELAAAKMDSIELARQMVVKEQPDLTE